MRTAVPPALLAIFAAACTSGQTPTSSSTFTAPLTVQSAQPDGIAKNHRTHLTGSEEVFVPASPGGPTPADSNAQGQATFKVANDGLSMEYKLIASNIENITQAHIHCGPVGQNGPIILWLYPSPTATAALPGGAGRHNGVLAEGTLTAANVRTVSPTASPACPGGVASFADALAKIKANNTYVNVHTNDGLAPTNQGPGDFPGGEVRGQLQ